MYDTYKTSYLSQCTLSLVTSESGFSALVTPTNVVNATALEGYKLNGSNTPWGCIPYINSSGWMEVGKHFEFHYDNTTGSDYSTALVCTGNYSNVVNLPSLSGTLALTSQIPTSLPANGGNADTVDNLHASDIYGYIEPYDLNNVIKSNGIATSYYDYATSASVVNQPGGNNVSDARGVITFGHGYPFQLSWRYNDAGSLYARTKYGSSWNPWVRISMHHDHPYLPTAGGTMTGSV